MNVTRTRTYHYVQIPAWFEQWALRLGFTVMSETYTLPEIANVGKGS